jgi:hypothetical protein
MLLGDLGTWPPSSRISAAYLCRAPVAQSVPREGFTERGGAAWRARARGWPGPRTAGTGTSRPGSRGTGTGGSCEEALMRLRLPGGWACPRRGNRRRGPVAGRPRKRRCTRRGLRLSVTSGTPTRGSRLPLPKWFLAFRPVAGSKGGVSAAGPARAPGTSEATARYVAPGLRGAMSAGSGRLRPGLGRGRGRRPLRGRRRRGDGGQGDHQAGAGLRRVARRPLGPTRARGSGGASASRRCCGRPGRGMACSACSTGRSGTRRGEPVMRELGGHVWEIQSCGVPAMLRGTAFTSPVTKIRLNEHGFPVDDDGEAVLPEQQALAGAQALRKAPLPRAEAHKRLAYDRKWRGLPHR